MPVSRVDGVSGVLNCLLVVLGFLVIFQMEPFVAAKADTLAPSDFLAEDAFAFGCQPDETLPDTVSGYLEFSNTCLLNDDNGLTNRDGDVFVMFERLNEIRARNGLNPLAWHEGAAEVARLHGADMHRRNYFSHQSPEGLSAVDRLRRFDRDEVFSVSGENLAYYSNSWPDAYNELTLQQQLEGSPSHLESMLNPEYTHVGAAIVKKGYTYIAVQVFIASEGQLDIELPAALHPGEEVFLPEEINGRRIGGWRLTTENGALISKAYDLRVEIPAEPEDKLNLVILGEESNRQYLLMNAPIFDLD